MKYRERCKRCGCFVSGRYSCKSHFGIKRKDDFKITRTFSAPFSELDIRELSKIKKEKYKAEVKIIDVVDCVLEEQRGKILFVRFGDEPINLKSHENLCLFYSDGKYHAIHYKVLLDGEEVGIK